MRKATRLILGFAALALMITSFAATSATADRPVPRDGESVLGQGRTVLARGDKANILSARVDAGVAGGGLKLAATQVDSLRGFVHERFDIYYRGLLVWGAQIIRHSKNGEVYLVNGEFHDRIDIDTTPAVTADHAAALAGTGLGDPAYKLEGSPVLMIYPGLDAYHLVYQAAWKKADSRIVSFIDAKTSALVFQFEGILKESDAAAVGVGTGIHGDTKKMSTDYYTDNSNNSSYYAIDLMRPTQITTGDCRHLDTGQAYYVTDSDNTWDSDGSVVDGHTYMGWIYDYYYLVHNRKSQDDNNRPLIIAVHFGTNYENAFFEPGTKIMYFGDANPSTNYPFVAALDIVAHEFTHGVTDATSKLIYVNESGALNEAFSDIMGVSCEFYHQPEGNGYLRAEWWEGEDIEKSFKAGRSLADPSSVRIWDGYNDRYPDHYSKRWILPATANGDWGGVHLNSTIGSHWYYLLAHGGTNRTSGITVNGIGLSKAEQIAYSAWVNYFTPSTTYHNARSYTYQAAAALYGADSAEAQTVLAAWTAVGVN
jgi:bacillolysin